MATAAQDVSGKPKQLPVIGWIRMWSSLKGHLHIPAHENIPIQLKGTTAANVFNIFNLMLRLLLVDIRDQTL